MELVNGGSVFEWIVNSSNVPLPEPIMRYFFLQMLQGVHHLHFQGFYHADLKLENTVMHVEYLSDKTLVCGITWEKIKQDAMTDGFQNTQTYNDLNEKDKIIAQYYAAKRQMKPDGSKI